MEKKKTKTSLLLKIVIAIVLGIGFGYILPESIIRVFSTISGIFSNMLGFLIPLIILGLVAPSIGELGKGVGKLLSITIAIAYGSTIFTGFLTYFCCSVVYPHILEAGSGLSHADVGTTLNLSPYFNIEMPPVVGVMTALLFAFFLGIGIASLSGTGLKKGAVEFRDIVMKSISTVIIPFLPIYIFGIFLKMVAEGEITTIMTAFAKVIGLIFVLHVLLLLIQYSIAGAIVKKNPFKMLRNMLPVYMAALGTQSSAAVIPITLRHTLTNEVDEDVAGFVIPLCATIHLSASMLKITACAAAIMMMMGVDINFGLFAGFIMTLSITMIAAPGVPGGAIMAATGLLTSMLFFDESMIGMMIALYIAMDGFGTAGNVTGDGAIAAIIGKIKIKYKL